MNKNFINEGSFFIILFIIASLLTIYCRFSYSDGLEVVYLFTSTCIMFDSCKNRVHVLKVKWYIQLICSKCWQIVIEIQTLKKIYKLKSQFQKFKKAASNESNTACACVLVKVVFELHQLIKTTINYLVLLYSCIFFTINKREGDIIE